MYLLFALDNTSCLRARGLGFLSPFVAENLPTYTFIFAPAIQIRLLAFSLLCYFIYSLRNSVSWTVSTYHCCFAWLVLHANSLVSCGRSSVLSVYPVFIVFHTRKSLCGAPLVDTVLSWKELWVLASCLQLGLALFHPSDPSSRLQGVRRISEIYREI